MTPISSMKRVSKYLKYEIVVEPSGVQCFDESNPLKDDEASALLDAAVLVLALFWGSSML